MRPQRATACIATPVCPTSNRAARLSPFSSALIGVNQKMLALSIFYKMHAQCIYVLHTTRGGTYQ